MVLVLGPALMKKNFEGQEQVISLPPIAIIIRISIIIFLSYFYIYRKRERG